MSTAWIKTKKIDFEKYLQCMYRKTPWEKPAKQESHWSRSDVWRTKYFRRVILSEKILSVADLNRLMIFGKVFLLIFLSVQVRIIVSPNDSLWSCLESAKKVHHGPNDPLRFLTCFICAWKYGLATIGKLSLSNKRMKLFGWSCFFLLKKYCMTGTKEGDDVSTCLIVCFRCSFLLLILLFCCLFVFCFLLIPIFSVREVPMSEKI